MRLLLSPLYGYWSRTISGVGNCNTLSSIAIQHEGEIASEPEGETWEGKRCVFQCHNQVVQHLNI